MAYTDAAAAVAESPAGAETRHPKGLYVLFGTEMWERFSFYTMNGMLVLYMKNAQQGFGWSTAKAATVNSWYLMFVYFTPLLGGLIADRLTGYRKAITIGGVFFMLGHLLLAVPNSVTVFFVALTCLVIGNGFFKPNVSSMVGNLYKEGSHLKDRAYLIFYMGINVGAFIAPVVATFVQAGFGYHVAFAIAAGGMVISLVIFWGFRRHTSRADRPPGDFLRQTDARAHGEAAATAEDLPPGTNEKAEMMEAVPEWKRIMALIVVFLIVIIFWMVFHQNSSTLTLWANDNTDWNVSGILSNAINPGWIILLSLPLAAFWSWMDRRGREPSTPAKMAIGMTLTGASFVILYFAAVGGGYTKPSVKVVEGGAEGGRVLVQIPPEMVESMKIDSPSVKVVVPPKKEGDAPITVDAWSAVNTSGDSLPAKSLVRIDSIEESMIRVSPVRKMSPWWLILAYGVLSLGELMLSPMGLSLVSKVAPIRMRGLMMGGWFAATAIGNKLTAIGKFWDVWSHATFFIVLGSMALAMAVVLTLLLRPLKKAMPGV